MLFFTAKSLNMNPSTQNWVILFYTNTQIFNFIKQIS